MEDIVPVLYEKIKKMFDGLVSSDEEIQAILNSEKKGTFAELYPMSKRVGKYAAKSLSEHYTEELLPDEILYWNIMERTIIPIMKGVNKIDNQLAINVQKKLDEEQKIGIKPQETEFQEDRVYDVMNKVSTLTKDNKTDLKMTSKILNRALVNISNGDIDKFIQKNAEFRANAGMSAKIIRTSSGHCCEWCNEIAGTYNYPDVPKDVYRRHDNCDCKVEYECGKVRKIVHSGTEGKRKYVQDEYGNYKLTKEARIAKAKQMAATEEERKKIAREKRIKTWEEKKNKNLMKTKLDIAGERSKINMYRRGSVHRRVDDVGNQIIDKATYYKLIKPAIKNGADIRIAEGEYLEYIRKRGSAVTIGDVIFFTPEATVSDVLEEIYHFDQNRLGINDEYPIEQRKIMNEILAQKYLLSVTEKYKIPKEQIEVTRQNLKYYENMMNKMIERGEWIE